MRLGDLLKGPHGPKSDIDGFVCDFAAPENRAHAMLERYAIEVVAIRPDWSTDIALKSSTPAGASSTRRPRSRR